MCLSAARGGIIATGDVDPADPTAWTSSTNAFVGKTGVGNMVVDADSDVTSGRSYLGFDPGSEGTVTVSGEGSTWSSFSNLYIGLRGVGILDIASGGSVSSVLGSIAQNSGSSSAVTVSGANSEWVASGDLTIGSSGEGSMAISGGAAVTSEKSAYIGRNPGGKGLVTVNGADSKWMSSRGVSIGTSGSGSLEITDGAAVTSANSNYIGQNTGGKGVVTVSGANSEWMNSGTFLIGYSGSGSLEVTDGAAVSSAYFAYIGQNPSGEGVVTVSGENSEWVNPGGFAMGYSGSGSLEITDGATVTNGNHADIGSNPGSEGLVTVSGASSEWVNSGWLKIGYSGSGSLEITAGATVTNGNHVQMGVNTSGKGVVTVSGEGSIWTIADNLTVGNYGQGELSIYRSGLVRVDAIFRIDPSGNGDSYITMGSGGMLALPGDFASSLSTFLGRINGTDDIRYWEDSISGWTNIIGATRGDDYTLEYVTTAELPGYTVLTVTTAVPEPATMILMAAGLPLLLKRKRKFRDTL